MAFFDINGKNIRTGSFATRTEKKCMLMSKKTGQIVGYLCPKCNQQFATERFYELHIWDHCDHLDPSDPLHAITKSMASTSISDSPPPPLGSKRPVEGSAAKSSNPKRRSEDKEHAGDVAGAPAPTGAGSVSSSVSAHLRSKSKSSIIHIGNEEDGQDEEDWATRLAREHGAERILNPGRGDCLFYSAARAYYGDSKAVVMTRNGKEAAHRVMRLAAADWIEAHPEMWEDGLRGEANVNDDPEAPERYPTFASYLKALRSKRSPLWGGNAEIIALQHIFGLRYNPLGIDTATHAVFIPHNVGGIPGGTIEWRALHVLHNGAEVHWDTWDPIPPYPHNHVVVEDAPPMPQDSPVASPPAICAHCKNPVSSHAGKTCRPLFVEPPAERIPGLDTDTEADTEPAAAEAPAAASTEPLDTEPAVAAVPAAAPAVAELPVAPVPAVVPPLSDDEAMVHNFPYPLPAPEPVAHPQPAPLNINLNPGNAQMDADSPINNNPNPSFSFLPFSS